VKEDWIVTDFLDEKRREIGDRLAELGPLVEEYHRLEAAAAALVEIGGKAVSAVAPRRRGRPPGSGKKAAAATATPAKKRGRPPGRPKKVGRPKGKKVGRPKGSTTKAAAPVAATATTATATAPAPAKRRAGRRKGSGTRAAQALSFVQGQPGITIPELAAKMGIKQNYLYRVLPGLEQEGKIKKKGRGWHPAG
jgi:hypothetical protein